MKTCIRCGEMKPLVEYYKHKMMADGRLGRCKACHKAEMRRVRSENVDRYREYDAWRFQNDPKVKERHLRYQETDAYMESISRSRVKFRKENPEKYAAHKAVQSAVRSGIISKPSSCTVCGLEMSSRNIHGHHEDYSKPLDVVWMCAKCHHDHHKSIDAADCPV